jgi:hypothetical protein
MGKAGIEIKQGIKILPHAECFSDSESFPHDLIMANTKTALIYKLGITPVNNDE